MFTTTPRLQSRKRGSPQSCSWIRAKVAVARCSPSSVQTLTKWF